MDIEEIEEGSEGKMWYVVDSEYAVGPLLSLEQAEEYKNLWDELWKKIKGTTRDSEVADIDEKGLREAGLILVGVDNMETTINQHTTSKEYRDKTREELNGLLGQGRLVEQLVKLADKLDHKGFFKEADLIDKTVLAMDFTSVSPVLETDKPLNDRELARAVRISIAAEHDATHFYELVADLVEDNNIKKLFQDIANEEKVHVGEFEKVLQTLDKDNNSYVEKGKTEATEKLGL